MLNRYFSTVAINFRIALLVIGGLLAINADAIADSSLKIGLDADMSAAAAEGGKAIYRGAKIAVDEINANGGVLGKQLELIVRDHRGNPARGVSNLKRFVEQDKVIAVVGGVHTPVVLGELDYIHAQSIPFLVPWAAGTPIIDNGHNPNYVFRVSVRDAEAAKIILDDIQSRGFNKVALILERTGWGRSNLVSMGEIAESKGITIVHTAWINWRQQTFNDEIKQISDANADAVVLVTNAPEGAVALKALIANDNTRALPVVSHWGIAAGSFVELLGKDFLSQIDLSVLQTFHFDNAINQTLANRVLTAYQSQFDGDATGTNIAGKVGLAHAYDLVYMLTLAINHAGSADAAAIQQALKELATFDGLVKQYQRPFKDLQDALLADDYILTEYDQTGFLVPRAADMEPIQ